MTEITGKKLIIKNTVMLYIRMFILMLVSLYTSRVTLKVLGVEDFGIYNVVSGVVIMFSFLNTAMTMATQRFLNFYLGKGDPDRTNKVFITAVNIHIIVSIFFLILCETVGLVLVYKFLVIPDNRMSAALCVYHLSIVGTCMNVVMVPYLSAIFAHEKMGTYAAFSIFEAFLKLTSVFLLFYLSGDKLVIYAILQLVIFAIKFLMLAYYSVSHFKECSYRWFFSKELFREMFGFMGWNIFGQAAHMASTQGQNMIVNHFCGPIVNASIAICHQVDVAISSFVNNFLTSSRPQIVKKYAENDKAGFENIVFQTSKFSFFLIFAVTVPIILNIDLLLEIWLEKVPEYSSLFMKIIVWDSCIEVIGMPLVTAIYATGNNRNYQIAFSTFRFSLVFLSYIVLLVGFAVQYVFYLRIVFAIFVLGVRIYFANRECELDFRQYLKLVIKPIGTVIVIILPMVLCCFYCQSHIPAVLLLALSLVIEFVAVILILKVGMTKHEYAYFKNMLYAKLKRHHNG